MITDLKTLKQEITKQITDIRENHRLWDRMYSFIPETGKHSSTSCLEEKFNKLLELVNKIKE